MTVVDGTLTYPPATAAAAGIGGAAHTNNDLDPNTATTLFDLDTVLDQIAVQSPANAGSLAPTGKLQVDSGSIAGFDIATTRGRENLGFATLRVDGRYSFYRVDVLTGEAALVRTFSQRRQVIDISVGLDQR